MLPHVIYQKSKKAKRARSIVEELLRRDDDIIVFQEAFKRKIRRILRHGLSEKFAYEYGPANRKWLSLKTNSGIWVLSNQPLTQKGTVKFDQCDSWDCYARKGAILLEGKHQGHKFQIVGTHTNGNPAPINRHQFQMIYDGLLKPFQEDGVPQIIAGDMNCSASNPTDYQDMLRILDAEDTPLHGQRRHSNWQQTTIIDYILLRRNGAAIQQLHKEITLIGKDWDPTVENRNTGKNGLGLSDHFPLEVEFRLH